MMGKAEPRRETGWRLELRETSPGVWEWQSTGQLILWPERRDGRNIFSAMGYGAESWNFSLRPGQISIHDAILYDGCHHFLTARRRNSPRMDIWETARVQPVQAVRTRYTSAPDERNIRRKAIDESATLSFPVVIAEKYRSAALGEIRTAETHTLVAVTPKFILCQLHDILSIDGRSYAVTATHEAEPHKNEYEISYQGDV